MVRLAKLIDLRQISGMARSEEMRQQRGRTTNEIRHNVLWWRAGVDGWR